MDQRREAALVASRRASRFPKKGTPSPPSLNQCLFRTVGVPILNRRTFGAPRPEAPFIFLNQTAGAASNRPLRAPDFIFSEPADIIPPNRARRRTWMT